MKGYTIQHSIELLEKNGGSGGGGGGASSAAQVSYDNTSSGLTGDNVQAAIDELANRGADQVSYDNTSSGLTGDNVQAAIDELAGRFPFPDLTNIIQAETVITNSATYTATEDCVVLYDLLITNNSSASITCDSISLFNMYSGNQLMEYINTLFLPKGKTITLNGKESGSNKSKYTVYGLYKPAAPVTSNTRNSKKK